MPTNRGAGKGCSGHPRRAPWERGNRPCSPGNGARHPKFPALCLCPVLCLRHRMPCQRRCLLALMSIACRPRRDAGWPQEVPSALCRCSFGGCVPSVFPRPNACIPCLPEYLHLPCHNCLPRAVHARRCPCDRHRDVGEGCFAGRGWLLAYRTLPQPLHKGGE